MYVHMYIYIHSQDCCGLRFHDSFAMADVYTENISSNQKLNDQSSKSEQ